MTEALEVWKAAILIWLPIACADSSGDDKCPLLRADQTYRSLEACRERSARLEAAAALFGFDASQPGCLPRNRCDAVVATLAAEGVTLTPASINAAYGEAVCPPTDTSAGD